jgi:hypothetical protein
VAEQQQLTTPTVDPRVCTGGEVMDPTGVLIRAIFDPATFIPADGHEPLHRWQTRAVLHALELAGHTITPADGARPTPPWTTTGGAS